MYLQSYKKYQITQEKSENNNSGNFCACHEHPAPPPLDSITNNSDIFTQAPASRPHRRQAYQTRSKVISYLYNTGIKHRTHFCGRALDQHGVTLARHGDTAFYAGTAKCGNRWICPVCAAKIAATYKQQLSDYITGARAAGDHLFFVTLTLQHDKGSKLSELLTQLSDSWNKLNTGRYLQSKQYYITTEILYGKNGWHPHYHILLNTGKANKTPTEVERDINRYILNKWVKLNDGASLQAQNVKQCNDNTIADYLSKNGMAYELTAVNVKNTDGDHERGVHPWHLIGTDNEYLFAEYIAATKGKRMNRKSKGFFDQYTTDKTEAEALHEEEVITETLATISTPVYSEIRRIGRLCDLLEAAEAPGFEPLQVIAGITLQSVCYDHASRSIHFDRPAPIPLTVNKSFLN